MKAAKPKNREIVTASLRLLAMRDMSRAQFVDKLTAKEFTPEDIAEAVAWCEAEGFLDEVRFAEVAGRRLGQKYGTSRIAQTLRQKGVNTETISATVDAMKETEFARAYEVSVRKFGELPSDGDTRTKQTRYLLSRGFSYAVVKRILGGEVPEAAALFA
jgi:regulatory protein